MSETEIRQAVFEAIRQIAPEADPRQLQPGDNLREALGIDSFDFLNLLVGLRQRVGVEIPEADYGKLTTLADLVRYLAPKTGERR
jgi:acyl carrier protein